MPPPTNPRGASRRPLPLDRTRPGTAVYLLAALLLVSALPSAETSEPAPLAAQSLLLDVTRAGERIVAVGAHGNIIVSSDEGATWTQVLAPTRALLTGVCFPDPQHGWAVGHDGVILSTADSGRTWSRQDSGADLDTVWLDVLFLDALHGFAAGAYGRFATTTDGGRTWHTRKPANLEAHYNRLAATADGHLYLCGEAGTLLTSTDRGTTWTPLTPPYAGSLFALTSTIDGALVVGGLRGHILVTRDGGSSWQDHHSAVQVLLMGATVTSSGLIVLAGQGGNFFLSRDGGGSFQHWKPADFGSSVADLLPVRGGLLTVGEAGAIRLSLP